jgi:hypothetical protein
VLERRSNRILPFAVASLLAVGCGGGDDSGGGASPAERPRFGDPGPIHVHGLGINPKDGALLVATHTGLFRAPEGVKKPPPERRD